MAGRLGSNCHTNQYNLTLHAWSLSLSLSLSLFLRIGDVLLRRFLGPAVAPRPARTPTRAGSREKADSRRRPARTAPTPGPDGGARPARVPALRPSVIPAADRPPAAAAVRSCIA